MSPGLTIDAQNAARRHSTTFISTPDWSVTTMDAKGTKVPAAGPDFTFNTSNIFYQEAFRHENVVTNRIKQVILMPIRAVLLQYKDQDGDGAI